MEPFGLLNFIKTALSFSPQAQEDASAPSPEPPPAVKAEEPIKEEPKQEKSPNAFLAFVDKHEQKAKKFRK